MKLKKMLKSMKGMFIGICIFIATAILLVLSPWIMLFVGAQMTPNPPTPEIKYAEFPFKLEYQLDGEIFLVEDTLVCKFDGFGAYTAGEKFRKWKSYLLSGNDRITLITTEELEVFFSPNSSPTNAFVFMGDIEKYDIMTELFPNALYKKDFYNQKENAYILPAEEMWEKYKLRILSWEIADPIENTFR